LHTYSILKTENWIFYFNWREFGLHRRRRLVHYDVARPTYRQASATPNGATSHYC